MPYSLCVLQEFTAECKKTPQKKQNKKTSKQNQQEQMKAKPAMNNMHKNEYFCMLIC